MSPVSIKGVVVGGITDIIATNIPAITAIAAIPRKTSLGVVGLALIAMALACGDPYGPLEIGVQYQLRTVDNRPVPGLVRTDSARNYYGYIDSASVEVVDDTSGFVALAIHEVVHLANGDSLTGGWQFRARARVQIHRDTLILDYRSRLFQPQYGWDFLGVDTAMVARNSLIIRGDSLDGLPRTVYYYAPR